VPCDGPTYAMSSATRSTTRSPTRAQRWPLPTWRPTPTTKSTRPEQNWTPSRN